MTAWLVRALAICGTAVRLAALVSGRSMVLTSVPIVRSRLADAFSRSGRI
jgi:hypothetical protein